MEGFGKPEHTAPNGLILDKEKILSRLLGVFLESVSVSHRRPQSFKGKKAKSKKAVSYLQGLRFNLVLESSTTQREGRREERRKEGRKDKWGKAYRKQSLVFLVVACFPHPKTE